MGFCTPKQEVLESSPPISKNSPKYADHPPPILDTDLQPCRERKPELNTHDEMQYISRFLD